MLPVGKGPVALVGCSVARSIPTTLTAPPSSPSASPDTSIPAASTSPSASVVSSVCKRRYRLSALQRCFAMPYHLVEVSRSSQWCVAVISHWWNVIVIDVPCDVFHRISIHPSISVDGTATSSLGISKPIVLLIFPALFLQLYLSLVLCFCFIIRKFHLVSRNFFVVEV